MAIFSIIACSSEAAKYDSLSKEEQLSLVKKEGVSIAYIQNPDKDVQLAAVNNWAGFIEYIQNPDKDVQLIAVREMVIILNRLLA